MSVLKLYYFVDPMCGWCYGFQNQMDLLKQQYPEIPIETVCGGMVVNEAVGPIGDKGKYIANAIPKVEELCKVHFGDNFKRQILNGTLWSGSLKPSIFINIIKQIGSEEVHDFLHLIQEAYFQKGQSLEEDSTYIPILNAMGLESNGIINQSKESLWRKRTEDEFEFTASVGISGFPTVVLENTDKLYLVSYGFSTFETMTKTLDSMLQAEVI